MGRDLLGYAIVGIILLTAVLGVLYLVRGH